MKKAVFFLGIMLLAVSWAGAGFIGSPAAQMGVSGANLYVAWMAAPDGVSPQQIHLRRSQDGGAHWLPEQTLTSEPGWSYSLSLTVSGPNVYMIYQTYVSTWWEVHLIASHNRGHSWSVPLSLSATGVYAYNPNIVATGSTVVAFWEGSSQIYFTRSTNSGMTWTSPQTLYSESGGQHNLHAAIEGQKITVAYERDNGSAWYLEYLYSLNGGASWQGSTPILEDNGSYAPLQRIEMSWPTVGVFWQSLSDSQIWLNRSLDGGQTWSPAIQATNVLGAILSPSSSHSGASVYLAYADPPIPISTSIYLERSTSAGLTWKPAKRLSPDGRDCTGPAIIASGSQVWLCYWDNVDNSLGIGLTLYIRKSNDKGVTWQPAKAIGTAQIFL